MAKEKTNPTRHSMAANSRTAVAVLLNTALTDPGDAETAQVFTGVSRDLDKGRWFLEASA